MADAVNSVPLTFSEAVSGILGSISLTCWIFLLIPQLIENYRCGSADAISIPFLLIWFAGDITNLGGAIWANLVPTIIAIAVYFCIADGVLISQCLYYNVKNARRGAASTSTAAADGRRKASSLFVATDGGHVGGGGGGSAFEDDEHDPTQPLLERHTSNIGLPGSRRRSSAASGRRRSSHHRRRTSAEPPNVLSRILEDDGPGKTWLKNGVSVVGICVIGAVGWSIAWKTGAWKPTPEADETGTSMAVGAQVLGYFSAVCYLGARIPQIIKNAREKSCEGLSLLFFILSLLGNLTYGAGILFHSTARDYFVTNIPWLLGSLGTMFEDITIFVQFRLYREEGKEHGLEDGESAVA